MSGIPSWAVKGARVVLVDDSPGAFGNLGERGDICELLDITNEFAVPACRAREINGKWCHSFIEYARLDRFRPLISQANDMAAHFSRFLDTRAPARQSEETV